MDAGPVALVRGTAIGPDEDAGELGERLAGIAADAIAEALAGIAAGRVDWQPQDDARATLAPKIGAGDRRIDWREPAAAIARRIRALAPTPGAHATLDGDAIRLLAARAETGPADRPPGAVKLGGGAPLRVATGDGWLLPLRLQRASARPLDVDAYLRGRPIADGARFDA
jgi:methionyl-tRNA formyltransferase